VAGDLALGVGRHAGVDGDELMRRKQTAKMQTKASNTALPVIWIAQDPSAHRDGVILFQRNPLVLVGELVVLAHRIARPVLRQQDAAEVRVIFEADAYMS